MRIDELIAEFQLGLQPFFHHGIVAVEAERRFQAGIEGNAEGIRGPDSAIQRKIYSFEDGSDSVGVGVVFMDKSVTVQRYRLSFVFVGEIVSDTVGQFFDVSA